MKPSRLRDVLSYQSPSADLLDVSRIDDAKDPLTRIVSSERTQFSALD